MHEYVHVLQIVHERDDDDDLYVPHPLGGKFVDEMEAYSAVDLWWEWKYGIKAPFNKPNIEKPEGFDVKRDRYIELAEKKRKGNLIVDEDADPPINEEEELEELEAYLENDVPYPVADINTDYDADAATNFECEEEE